MRKPLSWALAVMLVCLVSSLALSQDSHEKQSSQSPSAESTMRPMRVDQDLAHQVVKTYTFKYLKQPTEIQDVVNGLRTILEFTRVQPVPALPGVVARGSAEQIAAADRMIADIDRPRNNPATNVAAENYRLDFTLTELDAGKKTATHSYTIIVQRARNFEDSRKTSFRSGSRVPIATGSFQPGVGGAGAKIVNTQFNYQDVGVNMDCRLYGPDDDLTLNGNIELSNVAATVDIGGLSQPVIRQARSEFIVAVAPGKPATVAGLDSVESTRRVDVEVVATKLK